MSASYWKVKHPHSSKNYYIEAQEELDSCSNSLIYILSCYFWKLQIVYPRLDDSIYRVEVLDKYILEGGHYNCPDNNCEHVNQNSPNQILTYAYLTGFLYSVLKQGRTETSINHELRSNAAKRRGIKTFWRNTSKGWVETITQNQFELFLKIEGATCTFATLNFPVSSPPESAFEEFRLNNLDWVEYIINLKQSASSSKPQVEEYVSNLPLCRECKKTAQFDLGGDVIRKVTDSWNIVAQKGIYCQSCLQATIFDSDIVGSYLRGLGGENNLEGIHRALIGALGTLEKTIEGKDEGMKKELSDGLKDLVKSLPGPKEMENLRMAVAEKDKKLTETAVELLREKSIIRCRECGAESPYQQVNEGSGGYLCWHCLN